MTRRPRLPLTFYVESDSPAPGAKAAALHPPPVDVVEDARGWRLVFEVPGALPHSLCVEIKDRIVSVRGERAPTSGEAGRFLRVERAAGPFERALELPDDPDPDAARASYQDGLLIVEIPQRGRHAGRFIPIRKGAGPSA